MVLAPLPEILVAQLREDEDRGVLIESVGRRSAGGPPGFGVLQRFDVVTHVGAQAVSSPRDLEAALTSDSAGGKVELRILRKGKTRILRADRGPR